MIILNFQILNQKVENNEKILRNLFLFLFLMPIIFLESIPPDSIAGLHSVRIHRPACFFLLPAMLWSIVALSFAG